MRELDELTVHLFKTRNMVQYIKNKMNVGKKDPVTISETLKTTKVFHSLNTRLYDFLDEHPNLQSVSGLCKRNLRTLAARFQKLNDSYSEDNESNLSDSRKIKLGELILEVESSVLTMAGMVTVEAETKGLPRNLNEEEINFSAEAKKEYAEYLIRTEREYQEQEYEDIREDTLSALKLNGAPEKHIVDTEEKFENGKSVEDSLAGFTLGSVGRKNKNTGKSKVIGGNDLTEFKQESNPPTNTPEILIDVDIYTKD